MKKKIIAASWKMNMGVKESIEYTSRLVEFVNREIKQNKIIPLIFPDFLSLYPISQVVNGTEIKLGAQNCYWEDKGAFTGEVSPLSLKQIGCSYVLLGHPERISNLNESKEMVIKKVRACLRNDLVPNLLLVQRKNYDNKKDLKEFLFKELFSYIEEIDKEDLSKILFTFEPAWAIGTNRPMDVESMAEFLTSLREVFDEEYGKGIGDQQKIIYGGGVTFESARDILSIKNIDGLGMGRAGLNFEFFTGTLKIASEII